MSTQFEIFNHFNVQKRRDLVKCKTYDSTYELIQSAIHDRSWIAISGPIGSGKSETAFDIIETLRNRDAKMRIVDIYSPDREGIKIPNIMNSIIYQLGNELIGSTSVRRDMEARTMQVLRILSAAKAKGMKILVVIDEAHELHGNTLKAIKRLREHRFDGQRDLMTVIMIGQEALSAKLSRDEEVGLRCDSYAFAYTEAELERIAKHHSFNMLAEQDCRVLAKRYKKPLAIVHGIYEAMQHAYMIGKEQISLSDFDLPDEKEQPKKKARKKVEIDPKAADKLNGKFTGPKVVNQ